MGKLHVFFGYYGGVQCACNVVAREDLMKIEISVHFVSLSQLIFFPFESHILC